jgi:ubiquinone/menaquinone biosynthesis C-methylase UbiE
LRLAEAGGCSLGCAAGVGVRPLRRWPEFGGEVVGVDHSLRLIEKARCLTSEEGLEQGVTYRIGDAHALDHPDATFDLVVAHAVLSHVADPLAVLTEAARVVKPTGVVAVFDGDYASLAFAYSDPALAGSDLLTAEEIERWRAAQACAMAEGTFFGASNYYTYLARRPPAEETR